MTRISLHELANGDLPQSGISFARIRGEVGGLDNTTELSSNSLSLKAVDQQYKLIDEFDQATSFNTAFPVLEKVSEYITIDANPGYYLITDGTADSPTTITGQFDGYFGTDDGHIVVTDDEDGETSLVNTIVVNDTEIFDVNLKALLSQARGETTEPESLLFINNGKIFSSGEERYCLFHQEMRKRAAISTGYRWISGSKIKIINNGTIIGCGGEGGSVADQSKRDGGSGGDAIEMFFPVTIENNGYIFAGGGGGAGTFYGNGGGGGAGKVFGKGGKGSFPENDGEDGSEFSGGVAGTPLPNSEAFGIQTNGGPGGGLGSPGMGNILYKGGTEGNIVKTNGFILQGLSKGNYMTNKLKGVVV